ncbi:hypothetical protein PC129_g12640 [Phytophthora cactorum]|uniref:Uncharacterized protein n=1 Tax=Phytophthora cactorum TaxID=29920 RepID=A0A8T1HUE2_9STRA|nr:hypothetical protein PC129_g12640 [Phytophthora cactorum]
MTCRFQGSGLVEYDLRGLAVESRGAALPYFCFSNGAYSALMLMPCPKSLTKVSPIRELRQLVFSGNSDGILLG